MELLVVAVPGSSYGLKTIQFAPPVLWGSGRFDDGSLRGLICCSDDVSYSANIVKYLVFHWNLRP